MNERQRIVDQLTESLKESTNHRKIIKISITKFLEALSNGQIPVNTISDFEKLVKLNILLKEEEIKDLTHLSNINTSLRRVR